MLPNSPVCTPGREYGFHIVSEGAEELLGISDDPEDFFERCLERVPDSEREHLLETIDETVDAEAQLQFESPFVKPSGETIWLLGTATPERRGDELIYNGVILDITERKDAERALKEREEYLSVTLQSIGDAVMATDRDGRVTEMNSVAERLTGWSPEEAEGERLDDILTLHSARTGESVDSPADEVLREGTTVGLANHTVLTSRDGTEYQIADSAAPIRSEEGDLLGVVLVFRDITETYERRRQMERQNDLFTQAQDLANVGGWEYDVRSGEAIWTDEVYRIHGLPPDIEPSPEQSLQFYHEEDRPVIEEAFARAVEEGKPYDLELRLLSADGEEKWIRTRGEPQTEDGDVVRVRGTIQDITDRKKYEGELERITDLLRLAEEMTDVGGWSVDVRGERPYQAEWTDQLYDIFGLSSQVEPPTEEVFEYYHPEDRERHREAVHRAGQTGEGWDQELRLLRDDGTERWVHNIGIPITEEGEVVEIRGAIQDITDRKERERELQKTKRHLEKTLESLNEAVLVVDPSGREIVTCNSAVEDVFGYSPEALVERSTEILHVDRASYERFGEISEPKLEEQGHFSTEYRMRRKDGEIVDTENVVTPLKGDEWPDGVVSVIRDITERKDRERELAHQKALLEAQAEATIEGLLAVDGERNVAFYNDRFLELWDIPESAIEQDPVEEPLDYVLLDYVTDLLDDPEEFRQKVEYLYDHPEQETRDLVHLTDGRWVDRYSAPIVGGDGTHFGRLWVFRDVTERERRERELETLTTRLQLALESTDTGVFDWNLRTGEVVWDEISERLFGFEPGGFSGYDSWAARLHPDDLGPTEEKIEDAIENEKTFDAEYRVMLPDGKQRWIRGRGVVEYEGDEPVRMLGIHTDVTERREREDQLREAKEEAERMNRLKSAFLANMSHEIRTPLTSIIGFAEIIDDEVATLEPRTTELDLSTLSRYSSLIRKSGQRLMGTLEDVLNLSKLEAGEMDLSEKTVDLGREARDIVEQFEPQVRDAGLDLYAEVPDGAVRARVDPEGLRIALRNLVNNAVKYTEEGGQVWVRVRQEGDASVVEVEDTGIGMDPERVPELFESFVQESEGIGREYEGSGLGLTVTRKVVDQMEGSIEVTTEKGEGSCFTVRLPRAAWGG